MSQSTTTERESAVLTQILTPEGIVLAEGPEQDYLGLSTGVRFISDHDNTALIVMLPIAVRHHTSEAVQNGIRAEIARALADVLDADERILSASYDQDAVVLAFRP